MAFLLHHYIDRAAERTPDSLAFKCRHHALTYAQLHRRACQLARLLHDRGVRPMDRVGIYLNKSLETAVAVYGILKAGAAYVPIDPAAPMQRIAFILEDCQIRHLVTHPSRKRGVSRLLQLGARLEAVYGLDSEDLETAGTAACSWQQVGEQEPVAPLVKVTDQDLAYIMYTSGSTGSPKGLMHTHASGSSYARYSGETYDVQPGDRLGNHSHLHFDMSTFEFFTGPSRGATTVIIPEDALMFPVQLGRLIEEERLTFWYSVPLALIQLATTGQAFKRDFSSLRWVLFGGEPFPRKYLDQLAQAWPRARFSNVYGPAEVNQCTVYNLTPEDFNSTGPVPLGKVWDGAEGIILAEDGSPTGTDEVGELLIRSSTMMQGYWKRPEQTWDSLYIEEPFPGFKKVFYRTGDLVSEDAAGRMHFHGRKDRQVKIRGHRVELGEVEETLAGLEGVIEAAVVCLPVQDGENALMAAILPQPGAGLDDSKIRQALSTALPPYAVPSRFSFPDQLPRTTSGKINRLAVRRDFEEALQQGRGTSQSEDPGD
jgi:amino acid adenylation domain-containing protein